MVETIIVVAVVLAVAIAVVLVLAAMKPDTFRVERAATLNAPADKIFPLIVNFHEWKKWSPWENRDPEMKRSYAGPESGKGAVYGWESGKVGSGRMEILNAAAPSKIAIKLDFLKPFEAHNTAEFTLTPQGGATNVTWAMYGPASFVSRLMQVFMNMDSLIGKDFETGLANLQKAAEQ
jgi:hypothetical protein